MNIKVGDVCKVNGILREVIAITPHQEIKGSVYYDLGDGYVERDIRFHPEAVYNRAEISVFTKKPIKITQRILESGYSHLETILLIDDKEATRLSDWVVGYFHCKQCDSYQAYAGKLPPVGSPQQEVALMTNERNAFWRKHHHGDGRILLFEKDV